MDIALYMRVMWRFRRLMVTGLILAFALAFLSYVKVSPGGHPTMTYRSDEQWISYSTLFVTQQGFPWGRSVISSSSPGETPAQKAQARDAEQFADPGRFASLAVLY